MFYIEDSITNFEKKAEVFFSFLEINSLVTVDCEVEYQQSDVS